MGGRQGHGMTARGRHGGAGHSPGGRVPGWTRPRRGARTHGRATAGAKACRHHDGTGTQDARLAVCVERPRREGGARPPQVAGI